jgi:formamidopyrimidine-DNA glycosylase
VRRELEPWLTGRKILSASLEDAPPGPKYAGLERAVGQRIVSVGRRGKFLLLPLDGGDELVIHLGMTGVVTPRRPEKHLRVRVTLDEEPALYFQDARRFGRFLLVPAGDYASLPTLRAMGPEPLGDGFSEAQFYRALQASVVAIKPYLLSQRPVSGVGNIYADEALWRSRVHPLTPAHKVPKAKVPVLMRAIREVLAASLEAQGTTLNDYRTVNGEVGAYLSELKAYGHGGDPCARCGDTLARTVVAGRGTHYCPRCQRLPKRAGP